MGRSSSKKDVPPPRERLPKIWVEEPSNYPSPTPQNRFITQLAHLAPFSDLKKRIPKTQFPYRDLRGEMRLLDNIQIQSLYRPSTYPDRPYTEESFHRLNDIISHHSKMGNMREESQGVSHPHTLHSFLQVAEACYHLGQDDKALPLLEQVFILADDTSRPEFTIESAEILNYIYRKKDFQKSIRDLEKKALPPQQRK